MRFASSDRSPTARVPLPSCTAYDWSSTALRGTAAETPSPRRAPDPFSASLARLCRGRPARERIELRHQFGAEVELELRARHGVRRGSVAGTDERLVVQL